MEVSPAGMSFGTPSFQARQGATPSFQARSKVTSSFQFPPTQAPPTPRVRRFVFTLLCIELLISQLGYAICTPFFPDEAERRGVSSSVVGWIFGSFQLVVIVGTPVVMKLVPRCGPTFLLNVGNFVVANGTIMFGFCWYIEDTNLFTIMCFATRMFSALGVAIGMVVGYGLLPYLFGNQLSFGSSVLETVVGFAFIVAPVIGSTLYSLGGGADQFGFVLPFLVLGIMQNLFGLYSVFALPTLPTPSAQGNGLMNFGIGICLPSFVLLITAASLEYISPTFEPYLSEDPYNFSINQVGAVFAVMSAVYTALGPLVGMLDDKFEGHFAMPLMGFGLIVTAVGYAMIGPADWVPFEKNSVNLWIGTVILGVGGAFGLIPTFNNMFAYAKHEDEDSKANAVAAMYNMVYAGGAFIGPILGGMVSDVVGTEASYTDFGALCAIVGVPLLFAVVVACPRYRQFRAAEGARERMLQAGSDHPGEVSLQ